MSVKSFLISAAFASGLLLSGYDAVAADGILGCDPEILERNGAIIAAVNQVNAEIGKANITQPTSIEQMTCADQQLELVNRAGGIHSQPDAGNISDTLAPLAQQPLIQTISNALDSVSSMTNAIDNIINRSFQNIASDFFNGLSGNSTDSVSTDCGMTEEVWLINQCLEMPTLPSVSDILGGQIGEITGAVGNLANAPERMIEQVCNAANSRVQGLTSNVNSIFENSAQQLTDPISDIGI